MPDLDGRPCRFGELPSAITGPPRHCRSCQRAASSTSDSGFDPRHFLQEPEDVAIDRLDARRLVPEQTRIQAHRQHPVGIEARTEGVARVREASHEQAAGDEHDDGDRKLRDHERVAQREPARALTAAALSGLERGDETGAHRLPGRRDPKARPVANDSASRPAEQRGDRA